MAITTKPIRTRYGTRRTHAARCVVPGCGYRGPGHYKLSLAQADYEKHCAVAHPRPQ